MIAELGRLATGMGCHTLRLVADVKPRNQPIRAFLATLPARAEQDGNTLSFELSAADAATFVIQPDVRPVLPVDEPPTAATIDDRFLPQVSGDVWTEIAARLDNVPSIENATRLANVQVRRSLTPYRAPRTAQELLLARLIADALGLDHIGIDDDFMSMGLESLKAVEIASQLFTRAGIDVPVRALFAATTIATLAPLIVSGAQSGKQSSLLPLQLGSPDRVPLFCFHSAVGDAVSYLRLARALGNRQPVYGIEASGLRKGEKLIETIEEMTECYLKEILEIRPQGPYHLLGWSFGGAVAYEAAVRLSEMGHEIGSITFMDAPTPKINPNGEVPTMDEAIQQMANYLETLMEEFELQGDRSLAKVPINSLEDLVVTAKRIGILPAEFGSEDAHRKIEVTLNCNRALRFWKPKPTNFDLILFRAVRHQERYNYEYNWECFTTGRIETIDLDCTHLRIGFEPHIGAIANRLLPHLQVPQCQTA